MRRRIHLFEFCLLLRVVWVILANVDARIPGDEVTRWPGDRLGFGLTKYTGTKLPPSRSFDVLSQASFSKYPTWFYSSRVLRSDPRILSKWETSALKTSRVTDQNHLHVASIFEGNLNVYFLYTSRSPASLNWLRSSNRKSMIVIIRTSIHPLPIGTPNMGSDYELSEIYVWPTKPVTGALSGLVLVPAKPKAVFHASAVVTSRVPKAAICVCAAAAASFAAWLAPQTLVN